MALSPAVRLMRFHQPIGILLLLWPTLIALWAASGGVPTFQYLFIFSLGVIIMRSAGCIINDLTDQKFDAHVQRTHMRPLASEEMSRSSARRYLDFLLLAAFFLLLFLPMRVWIYAVAALLITMVYPWMKRFIAIPQLVLGGAFAFSIPMVFITIQNKLPKEAWLLFLATVAWTVAYDTIYAKVDKKDDLRLGLKSSAILFGKYVDDIILFLQIVALCLFVGAALCLPVNLFFYVGIVGSLFLTVKQQILLRKNSRTLCFEAFLNNGWWGGLVFLGFLLGFLKF